MLPDVPTIDEAGVKGYDMGYWFAAYVPAGTPAPVVTRLRELLVDGTQERGGQVLLRKHRLRGVDHDARRAREVPAGRVAEVGQRHQGRRHRGRVTSRPRRRSIRQHRSTGPPNAAGGTSHAKQETMTHSIDRDRCPSFVPSLRRRRCWPAAAAATTHPPAPARRTPQMTLTITATEDFAGTLRHASAPTRS